MNKISLPALSIAALLAIGLVFAFVVSELPVINETRAHVDASMSPSTDTGVADTAIVDNVAVAEDSSHFFAFPALGAMPKSETRAALELLKSPAPPFEAYYASNEPRVDVNDDVLNDIETYYGLPRGVLHYQGLKEASGRCPSQDNHKGANGCYQFMAVTAAQFSLLGKGFDYRTRRLASAEAAARYLVWLTVFFFNEHADPSDWSQLRYALAGYNAGFSRMLKGDHIAIPNFYETQRYVHDIESLVKGTAYWVEPGDTLVKISKKTGWDVSAILRGNPTLSNDRDLQAETVLALPDPDTGLSALVLKRGMTLSVVSRGTGVAVDELVAANNLVSADYINAGDVLHIPVQ
jgi:LysM repeat protein